MKRQIFITSLALLCALLSCTDRQTENRQFDINTVWALRHVEYPAGSGQDYTMAGEGTACLVYDRQHTLYECHIATTPTGLLVEPLATISVTLVDKGGGEWLYLEDGDPHPLVVTDTAITIQRMGVRYTFSREDALNDEWGADIRSICASHRTSQSTTEVRKHTLSARERQQQTFIHWLIAAIAVIVTILVAHFVVSRRRRQQLVLQLRQIQEAHEHRAPVVREAARSVEDTFLASPEYAALLSRMATGQLMKDDEWQQVERSLATVYPGFTAQLRSLYPMSDVEYRTCLLIKLRIPNKDIAAVLAREVNTISSLRKRLYKKVFDREGGARDWDEFILSIGV